MIPPVIIGIAVVMGLTMWWAIANHDSQEPPWWGG